MKENNLARFAVVVLVVIIIAIFIVLSFSKPKSSLNDTTEDPNSNQPTGVIISSESLLEDE